MKQNCVGSYNQCSDDNQHTHMDFAKRLNKSHIHKGLYIEGLPLATIEQKWFDDIDEMKKKKKLRWRKENGSERWNDRLKKMLETAYQIADFDSV